MDITAILRDLESERDRLEKAIQALEGLNGIPTSKGRPGRKPGRPAAQTTAPTQAPAKRGGRRRMSAAERKRISEMMKKRWAERKKSVK